MHNGHKREEKEARLNRRAGSKDEHWSIAAIDLGLSLSLSRFARPRGLELDYSPLVLHALDDLLRRERRGSGRQGGRRHRICETDKSPQSARKLPA